MLYVLTLVLGVVGALSLGLMCLLVCGLTGFAFLSLESVGLSLWWVLAFCLLHLILVSFDFVFPVGVNFVVCSCLTFVFICGGVT